MALRLLPAQSAGRQRPVLDPKAAWACIVPESIHRLLKTMPDLALTKLDDLAVVGIRGTDAIRFLQGQLSRDIALLADGEAVLAGLHNAQGRCLAVPAVHPRAKRHTSCDTRQRVGATTPRRCAELRSGR